MKEFIKCRDVIVNKKNIQCVSIGCVIEEKWHIFIKLNDSVTKPIYIMCNNEAEARKEFDNIYKQLQEEIEESQPKKHKITLKEFWKSDKSLAIHCNTEEKAKILLKAFDKLGKKWCSGKSYLEQNLWSSYNINTCYNNGNKFCHYDFYKGHDYTIYEFEDVDLEN